MKEAIRLKDYKLVIEPDKPARWVLKDPLCDLKSVMTRIKEIEMILKEKRNHVN